MRSIDKENLQFITPMMLPLNKRIEADAYYLGLPEELKRELFDLEEMRAKAFNDERFIKDVYSLPMRDFVNVTTRYLPGVVDVKAVKLHGDSRHWLVSTSEIPTQLVVEILKLWIENHYQHEPSYKLQKGIEAVQNLLLRIVAHRTGVEQHCIGIIHTLARLIARHAHHRSNHFAICHIHLAAVSFNI